MSSSEPAEGSAEPAPAGPFAPAPTSSGDLSGSELAAPELAGSALAAFEPTGELPTQRPSALRRARPAFRDWRRTRPFWGGLLILLGGGEILVSEKVPFKVLVHIGLQGLAGYLLPAVMVLCGALLWFTPAQRTFYSVLSVLLALGTWVTSNLGGFLVGMVLGLVGGSLAFGWAPRRPAPAPAAPPPDTDLNRRTSGTATT